MPSSHSLLFDPSLTLEDHPVKEIAEGPVDILASEEYQGRAESSMLALAGMYSGVEVVTISCEGAPWMQFSRWGL